MAIEVIPKTKQRKSNIVKYALYVSVALLIIMGASYAFLYYSISKTEEKLSGLQQQLGQQMSDQDQALRNDMKEAQQTIERSAQVIDNHGSTYNFFKVLESKTHPQVQFTRLKLNTNLNRIELAGITEDYPTLGEQISVFRQESLIETIKISSVSIESGGKIGFVVVLTVNPKMFNFPPQ